MNQLKNIFVDEFKVSSRALKLVYVWIISAEHLELNKEYSNRRKLCELI